MALAIQQARGGDLRRTKYGHGPRYQAAMATPLVAETVRLSTSLPEMPKRSRPVGDRLSANFEHPPQHVRMIGFSARVR
jgi:hypothetical protein